MTLHLAQRALVALGIPAVACSSPAPTHRGRSAPTTAAPAPSPGTADSRPDDVDPPPASSVPATSTTEVEPPPTTTVVTMTVPTSPRRTTTTFAVPERVDEDVSDVEWWAKQPGACGGTLPPCWVMQRESGGNIRAVNATGCGGRGCYGKWQFDPRTSQGLGYSRPMNEYDEATQDAAARTLWAGGRGCNHWGAC